jgi:glycosyltransferase involved in cell wall biosynthesis
LNIALCSPVDIHALARSLGRDTAGVPPGLGSTATTPLTIELLRSGHHVTVYTVSNELPQEQFYEWGNLRVFVGPARTFGSPRDFYRVETQYLSRIIRADAPAFVHAHWTYEFALGALGSGVPAIVTIHDLPWNVLRHFRDRCRAVRLLMAYRVAAKGKTFTAVSPDAARHFQRWLRPSASIRIIPNFLQDAVFDLGRNPAPLSDRPFTFVTLLQGWSRRKNATSALQAFEQLRRTLPQACLIMLGKDYEADGPAQNWAASHSLQSGVSFLGEMQHEAMLSFVHRETDALLHPSLDESFSVAALECMALRKPVIAGSRTPGVRWVLDDGRVGLLADVRDPAALAAAMHRIATDGQLRDDLSHAAFERAWSNFRSAVVLPQYEALYREAESNLRPTSRRWREAGERA